MRRPIGERQPWFKRLLLLIIVVVIAYVVGAGRRRWQQLKEDKIEHQQQVQQNTNTGVGGSAATGTDADSNPVSTGSGDQQPPAEIKDTSNIVLKEVKRTTTRVEETAAVQLTNAFEMAFNQRSAANMLPLFADQKAVSDKIVQVSEANSYRPIAFRFENIEVKGDSSILVTVAEDRADNENNRLTVRRLLEFIPQNGVYKIGNYFTPDKADTGSGFSKE